MSKSGTSGAYNDMAGWKSCFNMYDNNHPRSLGGNVTGEKDISVLEKTKVDVKCLNRKLEDMKRYLVELRMQTSLGFQSVEIEQEIELANELEKLRKVVEDDSY